MKKLNSIISLVLLAATLNCLSPMQVANASAADTDLALTMSTASNQYAYLASNSSNNSFTSLTLEAWVRPTVYASSFGVIGKEVAYTLYSQGGYWYYALANSSGSWAGIYTALPVKLNEWHHIALTRAAGQNVANFYIDGLLVFSSTADGAGTGSIGANSYALYIGDRSGQTNGSVDTNWLFPGQIDEVRIWKSSRTQTQIVSDMNSFGPTSDSNLVYYFSFNNGTGANDSTSGAGDLTLMNSPTFTDIKSVNTSNISGYSVVSFTRTYLNSNGGWSVPSNINSIDALAVGAGGGGGNNAGAGGAGGGSFRGSGIPVSGSSLIPIHVGTGGLGGSYATHGTITYNGTNYMNGQNGDSSTVTISGTTYVGGGGGGGHTYWGDNYCDNAHVISSTWNFAGVGSGLGSNGGLGGYSSTTQSLANGASGYQDSITGTATYYGSGGGGGYMSAGWAVGLGANSIGGNGGNGAVGGNGSPNTGAGAGGGPAGCTDGGIGGSGIVILKYKNYFGASVSLSVNPKKTTKNSGSTPITAVTTSSGTVTFYANGRVINGCNNVTVSGTTATCYWRPMTHGQVTLTATYASNDPVYSGSAAAPAYVTTVGKRTTAR